MPAEGLFRSSICWTVRAASPGMERCGYGAECTLPLGVSWGVEALNPDVQVRPVATLKPNTCPEAARMSRPSENPSPR